MASKKFYYKIGEMGHMFYDTQSRLKVTQNVPGVTTDNKSKQTIEALRNGAIIEIQENEYEKMLMVLGPNERQMVRAEHAGKDLPKSMTEKEETKARAFEKENPGKEYGKLVEISDSKSDDEDNEDEDEQDERKQLIARLEAIKNVSKEKLKDVAKGSNAEIQAYLKTVEKK